MVFSVAVDGFRLAYERTGVGDPVLLLHGWPGDRSDYRDVVALLPDHDVVVPDLRGFGGSDKHPADPGTQYDADAQARSIIGLITELGLDRPVLAGHDIGSRVAQVVARQRPDLVRALVLTPPLPGIGDRLLAPDVQPEFWYLPFNRLPLASELLDGRPDAVRAFLRHFWSHWSAPGFTLPEEHFDHLVAGYAEPGAFTAALGWYRAGIGRLGQVLAERAPEPRLRIRVATTVLWPGCDPLFPPAWSDRLGDFFADVRLEHLPGVGHFVPLEAPPAFAAAVTGAGSATRPAS